MRRCRSQEKTGAQKMFMAQKLMMPPVCFHPVFVSQVPFYLLALTPTHDLSTTAHSHATQL